MEKGELRKKLLALVLWLTLVPTILSVKTVRGDFSLNQQVLIACDEEFESTSFWVYGQFPAGIIPVDLKIYLDFHMKRVNYRFNSLGVNLVVFKRVHWDSNDGCGSDTLLLDEAMEQTGFKVMSGIFLLTLTAQGTPDDGMIGYALPNLGACIVEKTEEWAVDNLIEHELTHLFGVLDHFNLADCVMEQTVEFYDFIYIEDLKPIYDWNYAWICGYSPKGYLQNYWCQECTNGIMEYVWTHYPPLFDPSDAPIVEAPIARIATILIVVGIVVVAAFAIRMLFKREKQKLKLLR